MQIEDTDILFSGAKKLISELYDAIKIDSETITKSLSVALSDMSGIIKRTLYPNISDDEKDRLLSNCSKWAELGWTVPPYANDNFISQNPNDYSNEEINSVIQYFTESNNVSILFSYLKECENVKAVDLEEAISDFNSEKYKSCIMILFSLVDELLIKNQREDEKIKKKNNTYRATGASAAQKIINREEIKNKPLRIHLCIYNTLSCITNFYKFGDDFKNQPKLANRHYIMHGMYQKEVTDIDCIQMFQIYYNMLFLIDE